MRFTSLGGDAEHYTFSASAAFLVLLVRVLPFTMLLGSMLALVRLTTCKKLTNSSLLPKLSLITMPCLVYLIVADPYNNNRSSSVGLTVWSGESFGCFLPDNWQAWSAVFVSWSALQSVLGCLSFDSKAGACLTIWSPGSFGRWAARVCEPGSPS